MRGQVLAVVTIVGVAGLRRKSRQQGEGTLEGEPAATLGMCGTKGGDDSSSKPIISIVNGRDAGACEWRWQVGLRTPGETGLPWCGGMLIDPEWVLTAAHCLDDGAAVEVVAGEHSISNATGQEQVRSSAQIFLHPHYSKARYQYDFALVRLAEPVTVSECIGTVCLPNPGEEVSPGTKCWITGWGTLKSYGEQPDILQEAEVTILSNRDCKHNFEYSFHEITQDMMCAQGTNDDGGITDACQSDSGGPLVCETAPGQWTLHGATSWGYGCAFQEAPGVWARLTEATEWIAEVQAGNSDFVPTKPAPPRCSDEALVGRPDGAGDCICAPHKYCSRDGGESYDCPMYATGFNPLRRQLFGYDCTDCVCYPFKPTLPPLPSFFR